MTKLRVKEFLRETISYVLVGAFATLISLALQFMLTTVFLFSYSLSSVLCFVLTSPISFTLNRKYTFHAGGLSVKKTLSRYYLIIIPCFILSYLVMKPGFDILVNAMHLPWQEKYLIYTKQLLANGTFIIINYLGQKFFAFRKEETDAEQSAVEPAP